MPCLTSSSCLCSQSFSRDHLRRVSLLGWSPVQGPLLEELDVRSDNNFDYCSAVSLDPNGEFVERYYPTEPLLGYWGPMPRLRRLAISRGWQVTRTDVLHFAASMPALQELRVSGRAHVHAVVIGGAGSEVAGQGHRVACDKHGGFRPGCLALSRALWLWRCRSDA